MRYYILIHRADHSDRRRLKGIWQAVQRWINFLPNHPNQSDFLLIFCGKLIWQENQYNKIWESEKCEKISQSVTY